MANRYNRIYISDVNEIIELANIVSKILGNINNIWG